MIDYSVKYAAKWCSILQLFSLSFFIVFSSCASTNPGSDVEQTEDDNNESDGQANAGDKGHQDKNKPNIIILYADDLGWTDLASQGSVYYESPAIDQIASEGMKFTNAYANAANCAPSRACLMSGLYTPRHGIYTVGSSERGSAKRRKLIPIENTDILARSFKTLPEVLKENGYKTCIAGKWHLSNDPKQYGFDKNFGGNDAGHPKSYFSPYKNPDLPDGPVGEHLPDRLSTEVSNWIRKNVDGPFFVYLPFYSVHTPHEAREDLKNKYQQKPKGEYHDNATYAAMIDAMDLAVKKVMNTLDELSIAENTIVIFTSDNGAFGGASLSRPLRGSKGMYYEGGIRVPFFVRWPGVIQEGTSSEVPVIGTDIFPTLLEIAGIKPNIQLDGESILPILKGNKGPLNRELYWHCPAYLQMYDSDKAYEDSHDKPYFRSTPCSVIRDGDWKLIEYFETGELELFNLKDDVGERNNLSQKNKEKRDELYAKLKQWRASTNAPVPTELNPDYSK